MSQRFREVTLLHPTWPLGDEEIDCDLGLFEGMSQPREGAFSLFGVTGAVYWEEEQQKDVGSWLFMGVH